MIIGIAGASGSGKTLVAQTIYSDLGSDQVSIILEDAYYKDLGDMPQAVRDKLNFDHPDALDHQLLKTHLKSLVNGDSVAIPTYDYATHSRRKETRLIGQHRIIVLEGILLFSDKELRDLMDIKIFIDTPLDICLIRRITRDIGERGRSLESVLSQYESTVRPMYLQFIEPSKRYADIIVPRGGKNRIAIDMIRAKMNELLVH
ncbi:MAG: uridine kinase [Calditrichaeota bacterium]|nr:uridine kinase [Calditrichota bacterium]